MNFWNSIVFRSHCWQEFLPFLGSFNFSFHWDLFFALSDLRCTTRRAPTTERRAEAARVCLAICWSTAAVLVDFVVSDWNKGIDRLEKVGRSKRIGHSLRKEDMSLFSLPFVSQISCSWWPVWPKTGRCWRWTNSSNWMRWGNSIFRHPRPLGLSSYDFISSTQIKFPLLLLVLYLVTCNNSNNYIQWYVCIKASKKQMIFELEKGCREFFP